MSTLPLLGNTNRIHVQRTDFLPLTYMSKVCELCGLQWHLAAILTTAPHKRILEHISPLRKRWIPCFGQCTFGERSLGFSQKTGVQSKQKGPWFKEFATIETQSITKGSFRSKSPLKIPQKRRGGEFSPALGWRPCPAGFLLIWKLPSSLTFLGWFSKQWVWIFR